MMRPVLQICLAVAIAVVTQLSGVADASAMDWTGPYVGVNAGYARGESSATDLDGYNALGETWSYKDDAFTGGAQVGYNWQSGILLFGAEADVGYLGMEQSASSPSNVGDTVGKTKSDFYTSVRARLGVAPGAGNVLVYATGGWIGVSTRLSVVDNCNTGGCGPDLINASDKSFRSGWTAGGGVEVAVGSNLSLKAEYLHVDLGDDTVTGIDAIGGLPFSWNIESDANIVRVGLNYRF